MGCYIVLFSACSDLPTGHLGHFLVCCDDKVSTHIPLAASSFKTRPIFFFFWWGGVNRSGILSLVFVKCCSSLSCIHLLQSVPSFWTIKIDSILFYSVLFYSNQIETMVFAID